MDITMKCPVCDAEWPTDSVKMLVEITPKRLMPKNILFLFPCRHDGTLAAMKRAKLISGKDARIILENTQRKHDLGQLGR